MKNCAITLKATGRLAQVNNEDRLIETLERCPAFLESRWQAKVQEIRNEDRDPDIEDVRKLVRTAAKEKMILFLVVLWIWEIEIVPTILIDSRKQSSSNEVLV